MKQIGLATLMYAQDYDRTLPPNRLDPDWTELIAPYLRNRELFHCPSADQPDQGYQYALPPEHSKGLSLAKVAKPAKTVMTYDARIVPEGDRTAVDYRHLGHANIGYVDGHVKSFSSDPPVDPSAGWPTGDGEKDEATDQPAAPTE